MEEKRRFATVACGTASVLLAGALKNNYFLAAAVLIIAAAAMQFSEDIFQPVYAEQSEISQVQMPAGSSYHRSMSESMSLVSSHGSGGTNSPVSHYRSMSESMSVSSIQSKAPNSYSRSMSEQASLSTGTPPSIPASLQPRAAPAPTTPYSASSNQRIDERLSPSLKMLGKKVDATVKNAIGGTPILAIESLGSIQTDPPDQSSETGENSDDGSDDSSSSLLYQLDAFNDYMLMQESMHNAALLNASVSAVFLLGAITVVVARQPVVSGGRMQKRTYVVFLLKRKSTHILLAAVVIAVSPIAIATTPASAQEYGTVGDFSKSVIEISAAYHMDSDRQILGDIYEESRELDGIWSEEILDGHYVRATFEHDLTSARDISIYTRVVSGDPRIEIYEKDGTEPIAELYPSEGKYHKAFLTNLKGEQDTFDLRIVGGSVEFDHIVDPYPIPTFVGAGTVDAAGNAITPSLPSGIQTDDILLLFVETANQAITIPTPNGGTWTEVTNSPQGADGGSLTTSTRLTVFWSRYNGLQGDPTTNDSGNHQIGVILAFRGVITTGNPWDITSGGMETTADTSGSIPGATTTVGQTLVVMAMATNLPDANGTTNFSSWANANLANVTERFDFTSNIQNGGGLGIATGEKATAGSYGATTNTVGTSATKGMMTIALKPPAPVAPTLSISQPDSTGDTVARGDPYNITYTLSDDDDVTTAAFFFDTNNSGLDGTAISGACATAAEGTDVTCQWDTTGMTLGSYYVYGIADDGTNPAVSAYSPGQITINPAVNSRGLAEQMAMEETLARSAVQSRSVSEQMTVTDLMVKLATMTMTEQLIIEDDMSRTATLTRGAAETLALHDAITKSASVTLTEQMAVVETAVLSVSLLEQLAVTEAVAASIEKPLSDSLGMTDTITRSIVTARSVIDHLTMTDVIAQSSPRQLVEQLAVQDAVARTVTLSRAASESLSMQEATAKAASTAVTEQMAMEDTLARSATLSRTATESLVVQDTTSKAVSKIMTEQAAVTDQLVRGITQSRFASEQLLMTDAAAVSVSKPLSDTFDVTDAIARSVVQSRIMTEQMTLQDTASPASARTLSEQMVMTDVVSRSLIASRNLSEQMVMTDAISKTNSRSMTEQLGVTEKVAKAISTSLTEQLTITETAAGTTVQPRSVSEQLGISDTLQSSIIAARSMSESMSVTDTTAKAVSKPVSESLFISDSAVRTIIQTGSMSEQLGLTETIEISISKSLSEQLGVTDVIARIATTARAASEQMTITDAVQAVGSKVLSEQMTMTDDLQAAVGAVRTTSEGMVVTDAVTKNVSKTAADQFGIGDSVAASVVQGRSSAEQMTVTESIARVVAASESISEQLEMADTVAISVAISVADQFAVSDSVVANSFGEAFAAEQLTVTDSIAAAASKLVSEQFGMTDSIAISITIPVAEQLGVSDLIVVTASGETFLSEQLGMSESVAIVISKSVSDDFALSDTVSVSGSTGTTESMTTVDAVARSVIIVRTISESLAITEAVLRAPTTTLMITDSLAIGDEFGGISVVFNLNLPESLVMAQGFASDFEGLFDQTESEGISIGDSVALALDSIISLSEIMALQDQIAADQANGKVISESMLASDSLVILMTRPPPPPPAAVTTMPSLKMTTTSNINNVAGLTSPAAAVNTSGTWNIASLDEEGLDALLGTIGMPVYDVSMLTSSSDMTMVLPVFWVSMEGDLADAGGFLTPTLSDLPAGMQVMLPINMASSMEGDENLDLLGNMTVSFTPAESAGNFTMLFTMLDSNPEADIADATPDDVSAFYFDVTIAGDFAGLTPDDEAFFEEPPVITFTVTEDWADDNDAETDSNGVPIISLYLLDEGTGDWIEIVDIEPPISVAGGIYTYAATLPHFSTYAVTAATASGGGSGGSGSGGGGGGGGSASGTITRSLIESLSVNSVMQPYGAGEELVRDLAESITFRDSQDPQHQRIITVQNVTVTVRVVDIRPAAFGTAEATLNFEITNKNGANEELVLRYFYSDPATGQRVYDKEEAITVGARESITHVVKIPFSSNGAFDVMIEAGTDDGTIASTDIAINVPWLEVYVYMLTVVIIGVITAPVVFVIYALRQSFVPLIVGSKPDNIIWAIILRLLRRIVKASVFITHVLQRAFSFVSSSKPAGVVQYPAGSMTRRLMAALYEIAGTVRVAGRSIAVSLAREPGRVLGLVARSMLEEKNWAIIGRRLRAIAGAAVEFMTQIGQTLRSGANRRPGGAIQYSTGSMMRRRKTGTYTTIRSAARLANDSARYAAGVLKSTFKFIFRRQA